MVTSSIIKQTAFSCYRAMPRTFKTPRLCQKEKKTELYSYKVIRDGQMCTEALFIALLNRTEDIILLPPNGKTLVALPFIPVKQVIFNEDDEINVVELIDRRLEERKDDDIRKGISEETAERRVKKCRIPATVILLGDILLERGVRFETKQTRGKNDAMIVEYVDKIIVGSRVIEKMEIMKRGESINKYLITCFKGGLRSYVLRKGEEKLRRLLEDEIVF
ncbi:hypothetical protein EIN_096320 [Entamoeba invadens IP1]|uniref:Uncharacterized protein n=1 Tax=Entamoeba invadens IP1 TaxID=370355 RepID=A0A0A1U0H5_ENTIV|nr:hypothetical protein EIN_096320 [Entamoeba invadens IP1]ELP87375.1 hypothetical protein EIN_096320 [Entamoeba invadens IP1]|eukprot:XP_004254146.1 hypothetical protein EIN_096320 [Entamoeba invadens IP1]